MTVDLLTIKHRNAKTNLEKLTAFPTVCPPTNFMKFFPNYPLNQKLPMPTSCPKHRVIFTKGKIGKSIWKNRTNDFNLTDPYCNDAKKVYEPLHDPHLNKFFANQHNRELLKAQNLITDKNEVVCSIKDLNEYRRYLFNQRLNQFHGTRKSEENHKLDKQELKKTKNRNKFDARALVREKYLQRMQKNLRSLITYEQRLQEIAVFCEQKKVQLQKRAAERDKAQQQLRDNLNEKERRRIFDLKAELAEKVRKRKTNKTMHSLGKRLKKQTKALKFWQQQQKFRAKKMKNQTKLLKKYQRNFQNRVKARQNKSERHWNRLFKNKMKTLNNSFKTQRILRKKSSQIYEEELSGSDELSNLDKSVLEEAKEDYCHVIAGKISPLPKNENLLSEVVEHVKELFEKIEKSVLSDLKKIISAEIWLRSAESSSSKTVQNRLVINKEQTVSFSDHTPLKKVSSSKKDALLKRSKTRAPTPANSFDTLAMVLTRNGDSDVKTQQINSNIAQSLAKDQTVFLEYTLAKLKNTLKSCVEQRALAGFDMEKMQVKMRLRKEIIDFDRNYLYKVMAESILRLHEDSRDYQGNFILAGNVLTSEILIELHHLMVNRTSLVELFVNEKH